METGADTRLQHTLPRGAYWDDAFFERERKAIFWSQWFAVARAAEFKKPGDYRILDVAGESVIVLSDRDGGLRAHLNVCRHRGSRLLCGEGTLRGTIRCPYHAWTYELDGTLAASPFVAAADVPTAARALYHVGVAQWGGFAFVHLDPGRAVPLEEAIGRAVIERTQRYPLCELIAAHTIRYDVDANWKVVLENYNECYHCAGVHPELSRLVPAFRRNGGAGLDWDNGIPHREGAWTFTASGTTNRAPFPGLDEFERTRHKGELIYPNLMLSLSAEHVAAFTIWPHGPAKTTIVCDFLFHPDEIAKPGFDPSDAVDFWDLVNRQDWHICREVQQGMRSHAFRHGYYAPMEDASLDIRRYIAAHLGDEVLEA